MWSHKKYKNLFKGTYQYIQQKGYRERVFVLVSGEKAISYESFQLARKEGWVKK